MRQYRVVAPLVLVSLFSGVVGAEGPGAATGAGPVAAVGVVDRGAFRDLKLSGELMKVATAQKLAFGGKNKLQNGAQKQAYGIYFDALMVAVNPEVKTEDGKLVADVLLGQIRELIAPGHEPNAGGGLNGWTHSAVAQAFLLVKKTPEVWGKLTADEKDRMDWIMKAMAVAGHFEYDDGNSYITSMHADDNSFKGWNPNHRLYLFVVLSAAEYFGPKELNEIYTSFDFDAYMKKFDELGFTNIKAVWSCFDWKPLMENGGDYISPKSGKKMGTGTGVKHAFTYQKLGLDKVAEIFALAEEANYSDVVTNGVEGKSWIMDKKESPFLGQMGMMKEFNSKDAEGIRSSIGYCEEDFCPYTTMYVTMKVLNLLPADSKAVQDIEKRIYVGNEDFLFKNRTGFHSFAHGKGEDPKKGAEAKWIALPLVEEVWDHYLKPKLKP